MCVQEKRGKGMFAAMLFAISIVALTQFAAYYWRAMLAGVAAQPVSERVLEAAGAFSGQLTGQNFETLLSLHRVTPELRSGSNKLRSVRLYYSLVEAIGAAAGTHLPAITAWSAREAAVCARYAAVQIERRWQANLELAAAIRSC
jgi:hypothetical protein